MPHGRLGDISCDACLEGESPGFIPENLRLMPVFLALRFPSQSETEVSKWSMIDLHDAANKGNDDRWSVQQVI